MAAPRPAEVRYNDWRALSPPDPLTYTPPLPVSVIVPCFEAPGPLAATLAGLEGQRWPRDLLEVIVVDDGSEPPLVLPPSTSLDVRLVRQERRGFGLARARNAGVQAAAHDILVFLDGDVIPEAELIAAHARWHHLVSDALTLGFCAAVSAAGIRAETIRSRPGTLRELFADRPSDPPWMERHMARTADLTSRHDDLFRAMTGNNFGIGRGFYEELGGFDESFARYGGEDTEFAYRAQVMGGLLVPVREAFGWHQGRWNEGRRDKRRSQALQRGSLAQRIAEPGFRSTSTGLIHAVPRHVVTLQAGAEERDGVLNATALLLADPADDVALRIEIPTAQDEDRAWLEERLETDPRVRITTGRAALDEFPASPFHLRMPAGMVFGPGLVGRLRAALGDAAEARAALDGGAEISIARAWALHRTRRAGGTPADYGEARRIPSRALRAGLRLRARPRRRATAAGRPGWPPAVSRIQAEARHVRGPRTAWQFLAWLAGALRWRLREGGAGVAPPPVPAAARPVPAPGVGIAVPGPRARAVFGDWPGAVHNPSGRHVDAVLADGAGEAAGCGAPAVLLAERPDLAVPAFDPAEDNPLGWVREVEPLAAALGPLGLLPAGTGAQRVLGAGDKDALLHCHHLVDLAGYHASAEERAGTLARIAARGLPVRLADDGPGLGPLLGDELHRLMTAEIAGAGARRRETLSIAQRRAALRTHSLRARARQVCQAAGVEAALPPRVSVLLATRRPALLAHAVSSVARQSYPRIELVLALHGPGFDEEAQKAALAGLGHPATVLRLDARLPLGAVLNAAAEEARGTQLAKMDDDDVYGPEHLWDLVLAQEYSGAALVGKFPATVWLARSGRTVRCRGVASETWSRSITGGTMLIPRAELERAGGWRRVGRHVDEALIEDVAHGGGGVYRTHDAGYILVRHGEAHTWERDDARFLAGAEAVHRGWRPDLAGIEGAAPPPFGPKEAGPP